MSSQLNIRMQKQNEILAKNRNKAKILPSSQNDRKKVKRSGNVVGRDIEYMDPAICCIGCGTFFFSLAEALKSD
jgi:hypothetical protein